MNFIIIIKIDLRTVKGLYCFKFQFTIVNMCVCLVFCHKAVKRASKGNEEMNTKKKMKCSYIIIRSNCICLMRYSCHLSVEKRGVKLQAIVHLVRIIKMVL